MFMNEMKEWTKMTEKKDLAATQNALKVRARAKSKKPAFVRPESWRYDKFSVSWRRPRGLDNKVRRKIKGWPPVPSSGYKGPKVARGLHPSGYEEVLVHNVAEVAKLNPETQVARIAHTVGMKKRVQIIAEARKLDITILNVKASQESLLQQKKLRRKKPKQKMQRLKKKPKREKKKR